MVLLKAEGMTVQCRLLLALWIGLTSFHVFMLSKWQCPLCLWRPSLSIQKTFTSLLRWSTGKQQVNNTSMSRVRASAEWIFMFNDFKKNLKNGLSPGGKFHTSSYINLTETIFVLATTH